MRASILFLIYELFFVLYMIEFFIYLFFEFKKKDEKTQTTPPFFLETQEISWWNMTLPTQHCVENNVPGKPMM